MHLLDDEGRVIVLRGASVGEDAKFAANYGSAVRAPELRRMRDELGMNAVRMLTFWEAVEPSCGDYDDGYIARFVERVREARRLGLEVVVDFHQDLFGAGFGMAGAPHWAAPDDFYRRARRRRPWMAGYLELGVMRAFDHFWRSEELKARYAAAVGRVVSELAREGVCFYELWNEPFWGTGTPYSLEREVLPSFYERVTAAVFAADPGTRVGLAGAVHTNIGMSTALAVRDRSRAVY
ncbi:MAG: cellulase family glycosylhydrolase, partial [Myxococcales bacterium]|nr:cellulase family glycosylhydrolase [Myxococcales bacterium]